MNESGIKPMEYRVLVKPVVVEEKTEGGIIIPEEAREKEEYAVTRGTLIDHGPIAFRDPDWLRYPAAGDTVVFERYAGVKIKGRDDQEYRLLNDKEIQAVIYE